MRSCTNTAFDTQGPPHVRFAALFSELVAAQSPCVASVHRSEQTGVGILDATQKHESEADSGG